MEYPELGMEAIWKIEVENFPAFIVVNDKGEDFFKAWQVLIKQKSHWTEWMYSMAYCYLHYKYQNNGYSGRVAVVPMQ